MTEPSSCISIVFNSLEERKKQGETFYVSLQVLVSEILLCFHIES